MEGQPWRGLIFHLESPSGTEAVGKLLLQLFPVILDCWKRRVDTVAGEVRRTYWVSGGFVFVQLPSKVQRNDG
ncbi:unnamed protein product [Caenorhabditis auriculariae]|uniref:Uncharacterized protein n=1 Tax=Caenorhabditis auriculariae TaxID=2777116 RepID=A0A8S1H6L8_9PELO|nr:unnamed protein product [Caenorhabditis auriculariae]